MKSSILPNSYKSYFLVFFGFSFFALAIAYISQYIFGLIPCQLCIFQRVPYHVTLLLCVIGLIVNILGHRKLLIIIASLIIIAFLINILIASYHVGVESNIFSGLESCQNISKKIPETIEELKYNLENNQASCNIAAFVFLSISMAGWNVIYSLVLAIYGIVAVKRLYGISR